jgi:hypothetical protein
MDMPGARPPSGQMPGSFEGHPENIGEYVPASAGEMAGGVKDVARGNIARGGHRMISGAQNAMLPALPFVAAAAPGALLRGVAGGYVGSKAAGTGAEMLGATPEQSELAGDVGGLVGGYGGVKAGDVAPNLKAKVMAGGKVLSQDAISHIPVAGRVVRRPSFSDYWNAAKAKAPGIYPDLPQSRSLATASTPSVAPASQTGEALGQVTANPVFSKTPLGPDTPPSDALAYNKIRYQGLQPGGLRQAVSTRPMPAPSEALGQISPSPVFSKTPLGPDAPPPEIGQSRGLGGYTPSEPPASSLGQIPRPKLVDQIMERTTEAEPYPRLVNQIKTKPSPELSRPVTENPVVGSLVRAMQKSGLPIAERPNLLLKGSGRVNRILGPEEDLAGPLAKSLRQARRQRGQ